MLEWNTTFLIFFHRTREFPLYSPQRKEDWNNNSSFSDWDLPNWRILGKKLRSQYLFSKFWWTLLYLGTKTLIFFWYNIIEIKKTWAINSCIYAHTHILHWNCLSRYISLIKKHSSVLPKILINKTTEVNWQYKLYCQHNSYSSSQTFQTSGIQTWQNWNW